MGSLRHAKNKGRAAENAVVAYLQAHGWVNAERRRLRGSDDRGDIAGLPGVVIEVKDQRDTDLAGWIRETRIERDNDGASLGVVVRKRRGFPWKTSHGEDLDNVGEWYALMTLDELCYLLKEAGW